MTSLLTDEKNSLVLQALENGVIYDGPGIKLENASNQQSRLKKRSQFRIKSKDLGSIYRLCENIDVKIGY